MSKNITAISQVPVEEFMGIQFQFLVTPQQTGDGFGFIRNVMHPRSIVPIHNHPSPEVFLVEKGALDVYVDGSGWQTAKGGEVAWVPGGVKHALRVSSTEPVVALHVVNGDMYHFFHGDLRPFDPAKAPTPPAPERIQRVAELCAEYGGWLGRPEDNAAIGLQL